MLYFVALRTWLRMSLIFQTNLPTPSVHLPPPRKKKALPHPINRHLDSSIFFYEALTSFLLLHSRHSLAIFLMDDGWDQLNCLHGLDGMKEVTVFFWIKGCNRSNGNVEGLIIAASRQEKTLGITAPIITLLPSITNRIPALARHHREFLLLPSSASSSLQNTPPTPPLRPPTSTNRDDKSFPPPRVQRRQTVATRRLDKLARARWRPSSEALE